MRFPSKEIVERVRQQYPSGCRVELVRMDDHKADLLTLETFSQDNRDRRIGNSTYRICRTESKPQRWYIHEAYNDLEKGDWAGSNGFYTDSLEEAISKINSFTKERQVIERKRREDGRKG